MFVSRVQAEVTSERLAPSQVCQDMEGWISFALLGLVCIADDHGGTST